MRLATFLTPEGPAPHAGEVRGDRIVAFGSGSVLDRLASGDLTPGRRQGVRARRRHPARARPAPARDLRHRPQLRRPRRRDRQGPARAADGVHEAAELERVRRTAPSRCPAAAAKRLDYEAELVVVIGAGNRIAGYAVADDLSARDLQGRETQWTRAKGFDASCPWGPWITTADEVADAEALRIGSTRQRRGAPGLEHLRPRLRPAGARRLHRRDDHARARRPHPHRHPGGRRPVDGPAAVPRPGDVVRCEVEGLGAIEHTIACG